MFSRAFYFRKYYLAKFSKAFMKPKKWHFWKSVLRSRMRDSLC